MRGSLTSGSDDTASRGNAVFVDTNLDTHLAMLVSNSDTVADLKEKILREHPLCFPDIGEINIVALKVKRRGHSYHLSESMLVRSAFDGIKKNWFLSVDASRVVKNEVPALVTTDSGNLMVASGVKSGDLAIEDHPKDLSVDIEAQPVKVNAHKTDLLSLNGGAPEGIEDLRKGIGFRDHDTGMVMSQKTNNWSGPYEQKQNDQYSQEKGVLRTESEVHQGESGNVVDKVQGSTLPEGGLESQLATKTKLGSKRKRKNPLNDLTMKENDTSMNESGRNQLPTETAAIEHSLSNNVSRDSQVRVKNTTGEPSLNLSSDANKSSRIKEHNLDQGNEVPREHVLGKDDESRTNVVDARCDKASEDALELKPASKRNQRTRKEKSNNLIDESETFISDSNKEILESSTICQQSSWSSQKNTNSTLEGLSTEILEGEHLQSASPSSPKRTRKKKPSKKLSDLPNKSTNSAPSSETDIGIRASKVATRVNTIVLDQDNDEALLTGQHVQGVLVSEPCDILLKEKDHDHAPEVCEMPSSHEHRSLVITDSDNLEKDAGISTHGQATRTDKSEKVEGSELLKDISSIAMQSINCKPSDQGGIDGKINEVFVHSESTEASEAVDHRKSSKKRKKAKKIGDLANEMLRITDIDVAEDPSLVIKESDHLEKDAGISTPGQTPRTDKCEKPEDDELSKDISSLGTQSIKGKPSDQGEMDDKINEVVVPSETAEASKAVDHRKSSKKKKKAKKIGDLGSEIPVTTAIDVTELSSLLIKEPDNLEKAAGISTHDQPPRTDKSEKVEGRELSKDISSTAMQSINCKPADQGESPDDRDAVDNSVLKTRKQAKKIKDLTSEEPFTSATERLKGSQSNLIPQKEVNNVSQMHTVSTSLLATDREIDDVIQNAVNSVQQIGESQVNAYADGKPRKSKKKNRISEENEPPELAIATKHVGCETPVLSTDDIKEANSSLKVKNHTLQQNTTSVNPLDERNLEHKKEADAQLDNIGAKVDSVTFEGSKATEGRAKERQFGNVGSTNPKKRRAGKDKNDHEVTCQSDTINCNEYFVHKQDDEAVASSKVRLDSATKAKGEYLESKTKKKKLNFGVHSSSKLSTPASSKSDKPISVSEEARRASKPSGTSKNIKNKKDSYSASNSSLESSKKSIVKNKRAKEYQSHKGQNHVDSRNATPANVGEVVNSLRHGKSLIGRSSTIFDDDSYGAPAEGDSLDNSDAGTRTPSENSLASDYSEVESDVDFHSAQNGSHGLKTKDGGGSKSRLKELSSGMTLDAILRSSSRYKKAKLTASQSELEDPESQPVDFVPESQLSL